MSCRCFQENYPLRLCVGDMAEEYCQYLGDKEPYCKTVQDCSGRRMEPKECRPDKCPFKNPLGCTVVSTCLDVKVVAKYKTAIRDLENVEDEL